MRGCPTGVLTHIGDSALRTQITAAVAMVHAVIRGNYQRNRGFALVIDAMAALTYTASALRTGQDVDHRIPMLSHFSFLHFH